MNETYPFRLVIGPTGIKSLVVGPPEEELDVTEVVTGVQVNATPGEVSTLILRQTAGHSVIVGEGIIYVNQEKIDSRLLLDMINPQELDAEAMSRMGWGEERTLSEIILDIIKEKLDAA